VKLWEEVEGALEGPKSGRGYKAREFVQALVWMGGVHGWWGKIIRRTQGALNPDPN
jgi:hypothetical protein